MNKYRARKTVFLGISFDSKGEADRYRYLWEMSVIGEISDLQRQKEYELIPAFSVGRKRYRPIKYIADFVYTHKGREIVEDYKGMKTPVYLIKRKLFAWRYQKEIHEIKRWNQPIPGAERAGNASQFRR